MSLFSYTPPARVSVTVAVAAIALGTVSVWSGSQSSRADRIRSASLRGHTPAVHAVVGPNAEFFRWQPLSQMATRLADSAELADDTPVVGVAVGGQARAYVLKYLEYPDHVYNDELGGTPVTVTYCEKTTCARVLLRDVKDNVMLGGWSGTNMMLFVNGEYWDHASPDLPLQDHPFTRTTWGSWRQEHPHTDVYAGDGGARRQLFGDGPIPGADGHTEEPVELYLE